MDWQVTIASQSAQSPSGDCNELRKHQGPEELDDLVAISPIPFGGLQQQQEVIDSLWRRIDDRRNQPNPLRGIATAFSMLWTRIRSDRRNQPNPLRGIATHPHS